MVGREATNCTSISRIFHGGVKFRNTKDVVVDCAFGCTLHVDAYLFVCGLIWYGHFRCFGLWQFLGLHKQIAFQLHLILSSEFKVLITQSELVRCRNIYVTALNTSLANSAVTNIPVREPGGNAEG